MKRLVIGILAHVDSGKTTLSEGMLYYAGEIRKLGRVDHRDTFLDTHEIERQRGITIFSKQAVFSHRNTDFTLLDTPGHVDFSAEMERTLSVLDYAILVVSGSEGVQAHTETLWRLLERYNVPAFIFVNKMDLSHRSSEEIMQELCKRLGGGCVDFSVEDESFCENIAMCDEAIMENFLQNGKVSGKDIRAAIAKRQIFPCYFGSALKSQGIEEFLNGLDAYTNAPVPNEKFGAKVFKISEDDSGERLTHMKITGASLKVKELLSGKKASHGEWSQKVNNIRIYSGDKFKTKDEVFQGEICAVTGLSDTYPGEGIGFEQDSKIPVIEPVLSYSIDIMDGTDIHTAITKLKKLQEEEPQLDIVWNERLSQIQARVMGEVQLDILKNIIAERFNLSIEFGECSIAYKETISDAVEGVGHYEPLRHYAEVHLLLEPSPRGKGVTFDIKCSEDDLDRNWQRLILTHLQEKDHIGVLTGSPITDIKITLIAGRAHQKHTEGGDFRQATYRAVRQGLKMVESVLLEPWYEFRIELPTDNLGRLMTDISQMGGSFEDPFTNDDISSIVGKAPVSKMRGYQTELSAYTKGRGKLSCFVCGYDKCANQDEIIDEIGYDSDADLENSADSVFCSHGAGFVVKWDKVREYMHIDTGFGNESIEDEVEVIKPKKDYKAGEKELLEIFESTYGPIRPRVNTEIKKVMPKPVKYPKARPVPKGKEYVLVDGYNIIFAWEDLNALAKESLDHARSELISILSNYQGVKDCEIILVFDAYKVKGNTREIEKIDNISVVYTKEAETADMYIEKVSHTLAKNHRVRVATSDNLEQLIILAGGALRVSAEAFGKEVEETKKQISDYIKTNK